MEYKLIFGTDGLRGNAEEFPFTTEALHRLGGTLGQWIKKKYKKDSFQVIIASDTRLSSERIKKNLSEGIAEENGILFDAGIIPTPAVLAILQATTQFDIGIMISASHNPFYDNGIKIFNAHTGKLSSLEEKEIEEFFDSFNHEKKEPSGSPLPLIAQKKLINHYKNHILNHFNPLFLKGLKIVLDCSHGATYHLAPALFSHFGATVYSVGVNPNGTNINKKCGSLFTHRLRMRVLKENATIGFAFDGDGDRVIAVTKEGEVKDGDDLLALLIQHPDFEHDSAVVGTLMTNHGLEYYLKAFKKNLVRTAVGDKYINAHLELHNMRLGGETSGHIIMRPYSKTGDGIFTAFKILETLLFTKNWNLKTFKKFPQILINVPIAKKDNLNKDHYRELIEFYEKKLSKGRVVVRFSGTENILRVMTEDESAKQAQEVAHDLAHQLQTILLNSNALPTKVS